MNEPLDTGESPPSERRLPDSRSRSAPVPYDLWAVVGIIWRYRLLVFTITAVGTSIVLGYLLLSRLLPAERSPMPNIYLPSALLLIHPEVGRAGNLASQALSSFGGLASLAGLTGFSGGTSYGELAITLLNSKSTIDIVADEFDLIERWKITRNVRGRVRMTFRARSEFERDAVSNTLSISFRDRDPAFAAAVVNRLVEILEQRFATIGGNQSRRRRDLLATRHAEVGQRIVWYGERVKEFQQRYSVLDVDVLTEELIAQVAEVRTQFLLKEVEIQTYAEVAPANDPGMMLLQAERENLLQLINEMESGYAEYERMMPTREELPDLALEFAQLRRDLDVQTEIYKILSQQYELAKLDVEGQAPIFQVLELAEIPDMKAGPSRLLILMVAFCVWLAVAMLAALLHNSLGGRRDKPRVAPVAVRHVDH